MHPNWMQFVRTRVLKFAVEFCGVLMSSLEVV